MFSPRVLGAVVGVLATVSSGWGQTCALVETVQPGDCFRIKLDMKLGGEMRIQKGGQLVPRKLEASASHEFSERVLVVGSTGIPEKTARLYETIKATIRVDGQATERALRPERRLIVTQQTKEQALTYSPSGALFRSELDACEHFDTLSVTGVLAGKSVAVGDTWKLANSVVQALCDFEGLTEQSLTGKLESVKDSLATFTIRGTAGGIEEGALVKMTIQATGVFDRKAKRLVSLEWQQKDERDQGPVSPATVVETTTTLGRQPIAQPSTLTDVALVSVPDGTPPSPLLQLEYRDPKGRFALLHGREWKVVAQTPEHLVMRLMDHGDFVAQVTVTPWTAAEKGKHLTPEEFKAAMNETSGWKPEKELQAGVVEGQDGRWVYRVSVLGDLDGVAVLQNFYLVAAPTGEQVVLAFTMTPKQADKLGARDLSFAGSLEVPSKK